MFKLALLRIIFNSELRAKIIITGGWRGGEGGGGGGVTKSMWN